MVPDGQEEKKIIEDDLWGSLPTGKERNPSKTCAGLHILSCSHIVQGDPGEVFSLSAPQRSELPTSYHLCGTRKDS